MLSRNNKILIGCLALLLVMSVGYALFSDTITINGSATAKGEFELTTTCDMDASSIGTDSGSVTDAKISCEGNVVNASATLGYPGSQKLFRVMVTNTGTIPAKLKKVVELNNPENMFADKDGGGDIYNRMKVGDNVAAVWFYPDASYYVDYEDEPWGAEYTFASEQFEAVLDPGETAYFYVEVLWESSSTTPSDTLTPSLKAQMIWEQITE